MLWFPGRKDCGLVGPTLGIAGDLVPNPAVVPRGSPREGLPAHRGVGITGARPNRTRMMSSTIHTPYYLYKRHVPHFSR
jgi:hypothetical protein